MQPKSTPPPANAVNAEVSTFERLPQEIWGVIASYLTGQDMLRWSNTCKAFYQLLHLTGVRVKVSEAFLPYCEMEERIRWVCQFIEPLIKNINGKLDLWLRLFNCKFSSNNNVLSIQNYAALADKTGIEYGAVGSYIDFYSSDDGGTNQESVVKNVGNNVSIVTPEHFLHRILYTMVWVDAEFLQFDNKVAFEQSLKKPLGFKPIISCFYNKVTAKEKNSQVSDVKEQDGWHIAIYSKLFDVVIPLTELLQNLRLADTIRDLFVGKKSSDKIDGEALKSAFFSAIHYEISVGVNLLDLSQELILSLRSTNMAGVDSDNWIYDLLAKCVPADNQRTVESNNNNLMMLMLMLKVYNDGNGRNAHLSPNSLALIKRIHASLLDPECFNITDAMLKPGVKLFSKIDALLKDNMHNPSMRRLFLRFVNKDRTAIHEDEDDDPLLTYVAESARKQLHDKLMQLQLNTVTKDDIDTTTQCISDWLTVEMLWNDSKIYQFLVKNFLFVMRVIKMGRDAAKNQDVFLEICPVLDVDTVRDFLLYLSKMESSHSLKDLIVPRSNEEALVLLLFPKLIFLVNREDLRGFLDVNGNCELTIHIMTLKTLHRIHHCELLLQGLTCVELVKFRGLLFAEDSIFKRSGFCFEVGHVLEDISRKYDNCTGNTLLQVIINKHLYEYTGLNKIKFGQVYGFDVYEFLQCRAAAEIREIFQDPKTIDNNNPFLCLCSLLCSFYPSADTLSFLYQVVQHMPQEGYHFIRKCYQRLDVDALDALFIAAHIQEKTAAAVAAFGALLHNVCRLICHWNLDKALTMQLCTSGTLLPILMDNNQYDKKRKRSDSDGNDQQDINNSNSKRCRLSDNNSNTPTSVTSALSMQLPSTTSISTTSSAQTQLPMLPTTSAITFFAAASASTTTSTATASQPPSSQTARHL